MNRMKQPPSRRRTSEGNTRRSPAAPISRSGLDRPRIAAGAAILLTVILVVVGIARREAPIANLRTASPAGGIVVLGDSLAAGTGARPEESYPSRIAASLGCRVINAGVPGNTTGDGLARLEPILAAHPWIVVVELGGNDFLQHLDRKLTESNLDSIADKCVAAGAIPVVVGVELGLFVDEYDALFRRVARRHHALYVPDLLGGVFGKSHLMSDQIHPNAEGYRIVAERLEAALRGLIASSGKSCR